MRKAERPRKFPARMAGGLAGDEAELERQEKKQKRFVENMQYHIKLLEDDLVEKRRLKRFTRADEVRTERIIADMKESLRHGRVVFFDEAIAKQRLVVEARRASLVEFGMLGMCEQFPCELLDMILHLASK